MFADRGVTRLVNELVPDWEKYSPLQMALSLERNHFYSIHIAPVDMPPGYFGAIAFLEDEDTADDAARQPYRQKAVILYDQSLEPTHRDHVLTHELGHLLLGHNILVLTPSKARMILENPDREDVLTVEFTCYAGEPEGLSEQRQQEELETEEFTRWIYQQVFRAQQKNHHEPMSSEQDFDFWLRQMGLA